MEFEAVWIESDYHIKHTYVWLAYYYKTLKQMLAVVHTKYLEKYGSVWYTSPTARVGRLQV